MEQKTAFISYSWDSEEHKQWVMNFANILRSNGGVNATIDRFITQSSTTNLNAMMITNMKNNDFVIIVLSEKFAERAENFQGGVGFETVLSLPILQENPDKLIFVLRHKGNFRNAFPFHLKGYYAIDFSDDSKFNESFLEILHRIQGVPLYEMEPVGPVPQLKPRNSKAITISAFSDIEIPNLRKITDKDMIEFLDESFVEIKRIFEELFTTIKSANSNFDFSVESPSTSKSIFQLFVDGDRRTGFKMWLDSSYGRFGHNSINLKYDLAHWESDSDSSHNESISCKIGSNKQLKLKMLFNMYGNKDANSPEQIVKEIWKNILSHRM